MQPGALPPEAAAARGQADGSFSTYCDDSQAFMDQITPDASRSAQVLSDIAASQMMDQQQQQLHAQQHQQLANLQRHQQQMYAQRR